MRHLMNRFFLDRDRPSGSWRILICVAAVLAASESAHAGLTLGSSGVTVNNLLDNTTAGSSSPVFDANGVLLSPGGGFPTVNLLNPVNPTQTVSRSTLAFTQVISSANLPPQFGTGTTAIFAQGAGQQGVLSTQGGIFWDTRTSLADNIAVGATGLASVSYSKATATFTNLTTADISLNPGAILSVRGTVGGSGDSYVAAGLATSYQISGSSLVTNTGIAMAANALGQTVNSTGRVPGDASSISYFNGQLSVSATSYFGTQTVIIGVGQTITINATLTLIADPMSSISIVSDLAPGFPSNAPLPDFGAFAGGTAFSTVPEPSTIAMLGLGLASVGAWRVRSRGRRSARA
jgi:PEP-CTERM motif